MQFESRDRSATPNSVPDADPASGSWRLSARALLGPKPVAWGLLAAVVAAVAQGVPTAVIPNPWFTRMTPVRPQDFVFLVVSAALIGLIFSTFGLPGTGATCQNRTMGSGLLSALAIGCPICNHVVVALIGLSGALTIWAPIQPLLGATAIVVLLWTLHRRLSAIGPSLRRAEA